MDFEKHKREWVREISAAKEYAKAELINTGEFLGCKCRGNNLVDVTFEGATFVLSGTTVVLYIENLDYEDTIA